MILLVPRLCSKDGQRSSFSGQLNQCLTVPLPGNSAWLCVSVLLND